MFTRPCNWSLSWDRLINSFSFLTPISLIYILVLHFRLRVSFPSATFSFSDWNFVCLWQLIHACYMPCPFHSPSFHHPRNILWIVQTVELLIVSKSPLSRYFLLYIQFPLAVGVSGTISKEQFCTLTSCLEYKMKFRSRLDADRYFFC